MDHNIQRALASLRHNPDVDLANSLAFTLDRSGFKDLEQVEEILENCHAPKMVEVAWRIADKVGRLPRLSPAAFMSIDDMDVLPQVNMCGRLFIRYKDGDTADKYSWDGDKWNAVYRNKFSWRFRHRMTTDHLFPGDELIVTTVDMIDFLDLMSHVDKIYKGAFWGDRPELVEKIWDMEVTSQRAARERRIQSLERAGRPIPNRLLYDRNTPVGWVRWRYTQANGQVRVDPRDSTPAGYYAEMRINIPEQYNHPMWCKLTPDEKSMIYSWAKAMQPK